MNALIIDPRIVDPQSMKIQWGSTVCEIEMAT